MEHFIIFLLILLLCVSVTIIILILKYKPSLIVKDIHIEPPHFYPNRHIKGGCSGTRYGCCPNGVTPKENVWGSNCGGYR